MDQNDKAYYLKDLELALLLSVKGMKELFGIKMNHIQSPDPSQIAQALFELEKKKFISIQKEKVMIDKELDQVLEIICNAGKMLLYINRFSEYSDQCIYLSDRAAAVSSYGTAGGMKRIECVSLTHLPEKICEYGFSLEEMISDRSLFQEAEIENGRLEAQAAALFAKGAVMLQDDEWGTITNCLKLFSIRNRKCMKQYLLVRDRLDDYFTVTDENTSYVYAYSRKKVMDTLKNEL